MSGISTIALGILFVFDYRGAYQHMTRKVFIFNTFDEHKKPKHLMTM